MDDVSEWDILFCLLLFVYLLIISCSFDCFMRFLLIPSFVEDDSEIRKWFASFKYYVLFLCIYIDRIPIFYFLCFAFCLLILFLLI